MISQASVVILLFDSNDADKHSYISTCCCSDIATQEEHLAQFCETIGIGTVQVVEVTSDGAKLKQLADDLKSHKKEEIAFIAEDIRLLLYYLKTPSTFKDIYGPYIRKKRIHLFSVRKVSDQTMKREEKFLLSAYKSFEALEKACDN